MKYLKTFEKFGISEICESQVKEYMKVIRANPEQNTFNFTFIDEDETEYEFEVVIGRGTGRNNRGRWIANVNFNIDTEEVIINKITIFIKSREDEGTLLHEVKHMFRFLRRKKIASKRIFQKRSLESEMELRLDKNRYYKRSNVFYLLNDEEFEAKYHGYYKDFDNYIKGLLDSGEKVTTQSIPNLFKQFLDKEVDKSWYWYTIDFKLENYIDDKELDNILYNIIKSGEDVSKFELWFPTMNKFAKYLTSKFKYYTDKYTDEEKKKIQQLKKKLKTESVKKSKKYRKKFWRIVPLIIDKYSDRLT